MIVTYCTVVRVLGNSIVVLDSVPYSTCTGIVNSYYKYMSKSNLRSSTDDGDTRDIHTTKFLSQVVHMYLRERIYMGVRMDEIL